MLKVAKHNVKIFNRKPLEVIATAFNGFLNFWSTAMPQQEANEILELLSEISVKADELKEKLNSYKPDDEFDQIMVDCLKTYLNSNLYLLLETYSYYHDHVNGKSQTIPYAELMNAANALLEFTERIKNEKKQPATTEEEQLAWTSLEQKKIKYSISVGDLISQLKAFSPDAKTWFGGLDFKRLKLRDHNLLDFEFAQNVSIGKNRKIVVNELLDESELYPEE